MSKLAKQELANIVDILASEYGWTIDYISNLDTNEVNDLLEVIEKRKIDEFYRLVTAIRYAFSKQSINRNKTSKTNASKNELEKLFRKLGAKEEDIKKGKLRI